MIFAGLNARREKIWEFVQVASKALIMKEIQKLSESLAETESWSGDLKQRLGWHDADKVYAAFLGTLLAARLPASELEEARAATPSSPRSLWPS
jgi:hypothetical protein